MNGGRAGPRTVRPRWRRPRLAALIALAVAWGGAPAQVGAAAEASRTPRPQPTVAVLDVVESDAGAAAREWSALAWDDRSGLLYAASDRGLLLRLSIEIEQGRIASVQLRSSTRLAGKPNVEALVLRHRADGRPELLLADERAHRVRRVDEHGTEHESMAMPGTLAQAGALADANRGVEALTWHPVHGLLASPQRPMAGEAQVQVHRIHGARTDFAFVAARGRSTVKALELLDGRRMLVLERLSARRAEGQASRTVLRELDLSTCTPAAPCDPAVHVLPDLLGPDESAEGLACLPDGLCLLATDRGPRAPSRLLLFQWPNP